MIINFLKVQIYNYFYSIITLLSAISVTLKLLPVVAIACVIDCVSLIGGYILNGCGKEMIATSLTAFGFYIVGIPLAFIFAFYLDLGAWGLLVGFYCGSACRAIGSLCCIYIFYDYCFVAVPATSSIKDA